MPQKSQYFRLLLGLVAILAATILGPMNLAANEAKDNPINLSAEEQTWLEQHPVIRIAPDPDFPPIEFIDKDGSYRGIAADFISLLEKKLPLKFEIVATKNWNDAIDQAKNRAADMFGAAVPTPERLKYMRFTKPYVEFPAVVLVRDSVADFPKLADLTGKRVAVVSNYADHAYMLRAYPNIPLEVMPDISSGLRQVSFGKVDAMILNLASASYYIAKDGISNLKISEDTDFIFDLSFAARSDWPILTAILEKGMAAITPQERKQILTSWISLGQKAWRPSPELLAVVISAVLVLVIIIILQWNRTLKEQVAARTKDLKAELEERLLAQQEKEKLQKQVHRSKKMEALGLLAGGVAHDLNNILAGVTGYADLVLLKLQDDNRLRKHVHAIRDSGRRASTVVADLLTISRDAAFDKGVENLNTLIAEYLGSPEHADLDKRYPEIEFRSNLAPELFNISCSPTHIKKSIMNLIINAAEATKRGAVTISTKNCALEHPFGQYENVQPGEYALLRVADSGPGIAAEDIEHIFEPFYSRKRVGSSGSGLGLAVVWNTMQDHQGYIDVEQPGEGSCFNLYFPTTQDQVTASEIQATIDTLQGQGETIMVIDDEAHIRDLASQMLKTLGYKVLLATSGEAAIELLLTGKADLLLLDMLMEPGLNGSQTYARIAELHPGQKALITSGFSESVDVRQAQAAGAGRYLKKPYTFLELGQAIKDELERGSE